MTIFLLGEGVVIFYSLAWYWAVGVSVIAFTCFSHVGRQQVKQRLETHFSGRPVLGAEEFASHYFSPERAKIAARLRKILANHVGMDISRMSPGDQFVEDLLMNDFDSMATVDFAIAVEKEFEIQIPDTVAEKLTTFQSLVDYVAEAAAQKKNKSVTE